MNATQRLTIVTTMPLAPTQKVLFNVYAMMVTLETVTTVKILMNARVFLAITAYVAIW